MAAVLGTNIASLYASKNLQSAQNAMANSVERLSSGLRINRARDDAAGLAISSAMTNQINSANQGIKNLNDGISLVQTAEGALSTITQIAQRILTLSAQGANGTTSTASAKAIQAEMQDLITAIKAVGDRTKFGGGTSTVFSGDAVNFYASSSSDDTVTVSETALAAIDPEDLETAVDLLVSTTGVVLEGGFSEVIDEATIFLDAINSQRGALGAAQNQLEFTVDNVTELSANTAASRSRVIDTDYATETAVLTKGQILQQAATAMLAQANQMPNVILTLLK